LIRGVIERTTVEIAAPEEMVCRALLHLKMWNWFWNSNRSFFAENDWPLPSGPYQDMPEEWYRYGLESLAGFRDYRVGTGAKRLMARANSPITRSSAECWRRSAKISWEWNCRQNVLIEPGCCADLRDAANWRAAPGYRRAERQKLATRGRAPHGTLPFAPTNFKSPLTSRRSN